MKESTFTGRMPARALAAGWLLAAVLLMICSQAWGTTSTPVETQAAKRLELVVGKSIILTSSGPISRASIAAPAIADFILLSTKKRQGAGGPTQIYITGKAVGVTNMTLWQGDRVTDIYDLIVSFDLSSLKQKLHEVLPSEDGIRVIAAPDSITLSGEISSADSMSRAVALAASYAPKDKIVNLLQVTGVQQVMLEVRMAEMSRSLVKKLGTNLSYSRGGDFGIGVLGGLTRVVKPQDAMIAAGPVGLAVSPAVNALFRFHKGSASWTGFIDALKEDGLIKILAEPTLIALSGQTANFLAGGEFAVPVPQGLGTTAIEYKPFGVGLSFSPTVLKDKISIRVTPEVSEIDFSLGTQIEGTRVPGLTVRRVSTVVELADGQSFAIAGLLKDVAREAASRYPLLGDLPVLGALFQSKQFQQNETELLIVVTPHLVKPLDMARQSMPTDHYIAPDDAEFFLLGILGKSRGVAPHTRQGLDGEFGHTIGK
jgi:pilus assembly protein CpaC